MFGIPLETHLKAGVKTALRTRPAKPLTVEPPVTYAGTRASLRVRRWRHCCSCASSLLWMPVPFFAVGDGDGDGKGRVWHGERERVGEPGFGLMMLWPGFTCPSLLVC